MPNPQEKENARNLSKREFYYWQREIIDVEKNVELNDCETAKSFREQDKCA